MARGIDVEQLEHVVNFDVPHLPEDYIHRVGRTARADATGDAFTFVSPEEEQDLAAIERAIGKRLPRVVVHGLRLREQAAAAIRGADRRAHRRDPGAEGGGAASGRRRRRSGARRIRGARIAHRVWGPAWWDRRGVRRPLGLGGDLGVWRPAGFGHQLGRELRRGDGQVRSSATARRDVGWPRWRRPWRSGGLWQLGRVGPYR